MKSGCGTRIFLLPGKWILKGLNGTACINLRMRVAVMRVIEPLPCSHYLQFVLPNSAKPTNSDSNVADRRRARIKETKWKV